MTSTASEMQGNLKRHNWASPRSPETALVTVQLPCARRLLERGRQLAGPKSPGDQGKRPQRTKDLTAVSPHSRLRPWRLPGELMPSSTQMYREAGGETCQLSPSLAFPAPLGWGLPGQPLAWQYQHRSQNWGPVCSHQCVRASSSVIGIWATGSKRPSCLPGIGPFPR